MGWEHLTATFQTCLSLDILKQAVRPIVSYQQTYNEIFLKTVITIIVAADE